MVSDKFNTDDQGNKTEEGQLKDENGPKIIFTDEVTRYLYKGCSLETVSALLKNAVQEEQVIPFSSGYSRRKPDNSNTFSQPKTTLHPTSYIEPDLYTLRFERFDRTLGTGVKKEGVGFTNLSYPVELDQEDPFIIRTEESKFPEELYQPSGSYNDNSTGTSERPWDTFIGESDVTSKRGTSAQHLQFLSQSGDTKIPGLQDLDKYRDLKNERIKGSDDPFSSRIETPLHRIQGGEEVHAPFDPMTGVLDGLVYKEPDYISKIHKVSLDIVMKPNFGDSFQYGGVTYTWDGKEWIKSII